MPLVTSVGPADPDGSGFTIAFTAPTGLVRVGNLTLRRNDIPGNVRNRPFDEIEAWIDQWLLDRLSVIIVSPGDPDDGTRAFDMHAASTVRDSNPLLVDITLSREPIP